MFRFKLSWILAAVVALIWLAVVFQLSAFATDEPTKFVWTSTTAPISNTPQVIEMKPSMITPQGMPPATQRSLLVRVLGKSLGGLVSNVGVVYTVMDLENRRQSVAYAINQLKKNGQPITAQTIQDMVAANNGIATNSPPPNTPNPVIGGDAVLGGFKFTGLYYIGNEQSYPKEKYGDFSWRWQDSSHRVVIVYVYQGIAGYFTNGTPYHLWKFYMFNMSSDPTPAPSTFNPANYPQIFGPDFYPSQIIDKLIKDGLDTFDLSFLKKNSDLNDHVPIDVDSGSPTSDPSIWQLLSKGLKYLGPIAALGDALIARFNSLPDTVIVQTSNGDVELSRDASRDFIDNGIPEGSRITRVDPTTGTVTYVDPTTGLPKTATVPPSTASNLTNNYNVYNTFNNSSKTTSIHPEVSLPEVSVSGSLEPKNGTLSPISPDRALNAKNRFMTAWDTLKTSVSDILHVSISGNAHLPYWTWHVLGHDIIIDFNRFATELNLVSLAFVFIAALSAVFIVINN